MFNDIKNLDIIKQVVTLITVMILMCYVSISCSRINSFFNLKDDNPIEEFIEKQIENQTGLDIDLTPNSKE